MLVCYKATTTTIQNPDDGSHGYCQFTNLTRCYYVQIVPTAGLGYTSTIPNNQPLANELQIVMLMDFME
ncbi:MAG: hypothetical protein IPP01_10215 [Saprospiraceae bacterium]|nr:hypothetical protein [Saprospiraceae bacterium]